MNAIPYLSLREVTKSFGGVEALSKVSFDVQPGQIVGVIGPNGAGKTTMFNVITGAVRPASGAVLLAGEDVTKCRPTASRAREFPGRSRIFACSPA